MPKQQFNARIDDATREKLEYLKDRYDSYSKVLAVAIDRLYQDERCPIPDPTDPMVHDYSGDHRET